MSLRKIDASYRILKILNLLSEKPRGMHELLIALNDEVYPETITKYFRLLREYGFIIEKKNHKFELLSMPFFIDFNDTDLKTLSKFEVFSHDVTSEKQYEKLNLSIKKILKIAPREGSQKYKNFLTQLCEKRVFEKYREKIEKIAPFLEETPVKAKLLYKNSSYVIAPLELKFMGDKVYLMAFDEEKLVNKRFLLDDVMEIKNLLQTSNKMGFSQKTVFRLEGRVAKGYKSPYENEVIEYLDDGSIIVENSYEDKKLLLKRLLKYFEFCEIISPKSDRDEFIKMVDSLIESYSK